MPDRVKVVVHHKQSAEPAPRPSASTLMAIYITGGIVLLALIGFFSYLLFVHTDKELAEVQQVASLFVSRVNAKDNSGAMQMIDAAWYEVKNQHDTADFLQQVEQLGQIKLDKRLKFSSEGVEGTVAYEISYSGHLGGQPADVSLRLIRRGLVLMVQAFRLE